MQHVMIDLETLSTKHNAVFLSIGAVQFDIASGKFGETFYQNIDLASARQYNRHIDVNTVKWWMEQRPEIFTMMFKDPEFITTVLASFANFMYTNDITYAWGNSASFDLGILGDAYDAIGMERPWKFYNERCLRTMKGMFPQYIEGLKFKGELEHDPIYDCKKQIIQLINILDNLKANNNGAETKQEQHNLAGRTGSDTSGG